MSSKGRTVQGVPDIVERVAIDKHEVGTGTRCDPACLQPEPKGLRRIDTRCAQNIFLIESCVGQGEKFGVQRCPGWKPVAGAAEHDCRRLVIQARLLGKPA